MSITQITQHGQITQLFTIYNILIYFTVPPWISHGWLQSFHDLPIFGGEVAEKSRSWDRAFHLRIRSLSKRLPWPQKNPSGTWEQSAARRTSHRSHSLGTVAVKIWGFAGKYWEKPGQYWNKSSKMRKTSWNYWEICPLVIKHGELENSLQIGASMRKSSVIGIPSGNLTWPLKIAYMNGSKWSKSR